MKSPGSPFRTGTLSHVLLFAAVTITMAVFAIFESENRYPLLLMVFLGASGFTRSWVRYRKLRAQNDLELIGDMD